MKHVQNWLPARIRYEILVSQYKISCVGEEMFKDNNVFLSYTDVLSIRWAIDEEQLSHGNRYCD